jgi:hypothetical protein
MLFGHTERPGYRPARGCGPPECLAPDVRMNIDDPVRKKCPKTILIEPLIYSIDCKKL